MARRIPSKARNLIFKAHEREKPHFRAMPFGPFRATQMPSYHLQKMNGRLVMQREMQARGSFLQFRSESTNFFADVEE